jgi:hypothetical protein
MQCPYILCLLLLRFLLSILLLWRIADLVVVQTSNPEVPYRKFTCNSIQEAHTPHGCPKHSPLENANSATMQMIPPRRQTEEKVFQPLPGIDRLVLRSENSPEIERTDSLKVP